MTAPKKPLKAAPLPPADAAVPFDTAISAAYKALQAGTATEHQQIIAMGWLINDVCQHGRNAYRADDRDTAFMCGRNFVAQQVIGAMNLDLATLRRLENDGR